MEFLIENNGGQGRFCFMLGEFCIKSADIDWDKVKKMELFFIIFFKSESQFADLSEV